MKIEWSVYEHPREKFRSDYPRQYQWTEAYCTYNSKKFILKTVGENKYLIADWSNVGWDTVPKILVDNIETLEQAKVTYLMMGL